MPTPTKPASVLQAEGKSHRTNAEIEQRLKAEEALSTGMALRERREVKLNPAARKEFKRLNNLLSNIGKNDAIYETIINRYCVIIAECANFEQKREAVYEQAARLEQKLDELGSDATFFELKGATSDIAHIYGAMIALDKQIQAKRRMLLDIEKECIMTIAAALRSIPKKVDKSEDPLKAALADDSTE